MVNQDNRINLYKKAINELVKIQKINNKNHELPYYDDALLKAEMQLLIDWYLRCTKTCGLLSALLLRVSNMLKSCCL
jgi:aminoglycoside/choline kinase family phosphotransferase